VCGYCSWYLERHLIDTVAAAAAVGVLQTNKLGVDFWLLSFSHRQDRPGAHTVHPNASIKQNLKTGLVFAAKAQQRRQTAGFEATLAKGLRTKNGVILAAERKTKPEQPHNVGTRSSTRLTKPKTRSVLVGKFARSRQAFQPERSCLLPRTAPLRPSTQMRHPK
jgi:hypothetical protein